MINEIIAALLLANSSDIETIRKYVWWVGFRRQVHDKFYFRAHWIQNRVEKTSTCRAHWI